MILVKRVVLYVAFFIMAIMMIAPGAVYYFRLEGIDALGNDLIKYNAENLVYLGIVGVVVLLVLLLLIHRGGVRVLKAIDKVSELSRIRAVLLGRVHEEARAARREDKPSLRRAEQSQRDEVPQDKRGL